MVSGRILLVEDAMDARFLLTEILKSRGYEVDDVSTGHSALQQIGCSIYDLIILDRGLPDLSGIQLLAALRANPRTKTTPILFVTGDGDVSSQVEGLRAGADDYIVKPYEPEILLARVAV